jgi:oxygen-independent coproporphyrinogen-3 oxidase
MSAPLSSYAAEIYLRGLADERPRFPTDPARLEAAAREVLDDDARAVEDVMLRVRLAEGLDVGRLGDAGRAAVPALAARGLVQNAAAARGRVVLTLHGRLLADAVVRVLLGWEQP